MAGQENQKFFDDCREMFMTDGWQAFKEELLIAIQNVRIEACETADDFWMAKGRLAALNQVFGWEHSVLTAEEQAEEDDESSV